MRLSQAAFLITVLQVPQDVSSPCHAKKRAEIGIDVRIFSERGDVFNNGAYVGDAERNVRNIFKKAREFCGSAGGNKRSIILMDDIDAVAIQDEQNSSQHQNRVVAQILTLMDGVKQWIQSPVVIATITRPNSIDPALRRPGRFDREIETPLINAERKITHFEVALAERAVR